MAGAAVAHSLLLGGPGFRLIHPAVYAHLAIKTLDPEQEFLDFPCAEDVPLNAATEDTKKLIDKVWFQSSCCVGSYNTHLPIHLQLN